MILSTRLLVFTVIVLLTTVVFNQPIKLRNSHVNTELDDEIVKIMSSGRSLLQQQDESMIQLLVTFKHHHEHSFDDATTLASIQTFLGQNTYTVKSTMGQIARIQNDKNVEWIGQYKPRHKLVEKHFTFQPHLSPSTITTKKKKRNVQEEFDFRKNNKINDKQKKKRTSSVDWRLSFDHPRTNEKMIALSVLLEDSSSSQRSINRLQYATSVMNTMKTLFTERGIRHEKMLTVSPKKIVMTVPESQIAKAAKELAMNHDIHWIEPMAATETYNSWARWITHSGVKDLDPISSVLTGRDQLIGIGDSGLDGNSCYFHDASTPVPFVESTNNPQSTSKHRKIHEYWALIDRNAEDGAHGTHVSGSVAGYAKRTLFDDHRGMAPDAKILFTDIGCTEEDGCTCHGVPCVCDLSFDDTCPQSENAVYPPLDLNEGLFPYVKASGGYIHTNSWGGGAGAGYGLSAMEIDTFAYENKDFLILFAAGNAGDVYGYSSLGVEAEAKNGVTVGASMNHVGMFQYSIQNLVDFDKRAQYVGSVFSEELNCEFDQCLNFTQSFSHICAFAKNFTTEKDCCNDTGYCEQTWFSTSCGCGLLNAGDYCCKDCAIQNYNTNTASIVYNAENAAYFTSMGPTTDLRIKPDVVAPGHSIISARAHDTVNSPRVCTTNQQFDAKKDVMSMGGTSMATPITAGNAALVREYYTRGYWRNGRENVTHHGFTPSSALIKATLINSGRPLGGFIDINDSPIPIHPSKSTNTIPDMLLNARMVEGFGRVTLSDTLYFSAIGEKQEEKQQLLIGRVENLRTKVDKEELGDPIIGNSQAHEYCLSVVEGSRLKVTLVWTDYPSSPARQSHLINNLDLIVKDSVNKRLYYGNNEDHTSTLRDNINNVEQVEIGSPSIGEYMVRVEGSSVFKAQSYALVISGKNVHYRQCASSEVFYYDNENSNNHSAVNVGNYNIYFFVTFTMILVLTIAVVVLGVLLYKTYLRTKQLSTEKDQSLITELQQQERESFNE